jgi:ABC-type multidrug transport system fused ATPase/permease subunit
VLLETADAMRSPGHRHGGLRAGQHAGDSRGAEGRSGHGDRGLRWTDGIHIEGLSKRYGEGDTAVDALKDVNMRIAPGEVVGLVGPSRDRARLRCSNASAR